MVLSGILISLSASDARGDDADRMARLGFLEWLGSLPPGQSVAAAAFEAAIRMHAFVASAPAVGGFRRLIWLASLPLPPVAGRRPKAARRGRGDRRAPLAPDTGLSHGRH